MGLVYGKLCLTEWGYRMGRKKEVILDKKMSTLNVSLLRRLCRVAGIEYKNYACMTRGKGALGGLLSDYEENFPGEKLRLLRVVTKLVDNDGMSMGDVIKGGGITWMDVLRARQGSDEYRRLWETGESVRREIFATLLEERLISRALNGFEQEQVKVMSDGEVVKYKQWVQNDRVGLDILKSLVGVGSRTLDNGVKLGGVLGGQRDKISDKKKRVGVDKKGDIKDADSVAVYGDRVSALKELEKIAGKKWGGSKRVVVGGDGMVEEDEV